MLVSTEIESTIARDYLGRHHAGVFKTLFPLGKTKKTGTRKSPPLSNRRAEMASAEMMPVSAVAVSVAELPAVVWEIVVTDAVRAVSAVKVRGTLARLAASKSLLSLARKALGKMGLIKLRCTLGDVPRAVEIFVTDELRVVEYQRPRPNAHDPEERRRRVLAARRALERAQKAGRRFKALVSDDTDESGFGWLPEWIDYTAVCDVSLLGDAVGSLNRASVAKLTIHCRGDPGGYPNLSAIEKLREVTITSMDFDDDEQPVAAGGFKSATLERLVLSYCTMPRVPPVLGLPNLKALELKHCVFSGDEDEPPTVLRCLGGLGGLGGPGAPGIEYLRMKGCDGVLDASPIARMPKLKRLTMVGCAPQSDEMPDFSHQAIGALKPRLLSGELAGRLCKVIVNRLNINRPERLASAIVQCADDCCRVCEELDAE